MKLPTFLIIGVQKSGTTSIYNYLTQHPQIFMCPIKETVFLEQHWEEKNDSGAPESGSSKAKTFEQYRNLFEDAGDGDEVGEISPNCHFHYKSSIERIHKYLPDVKLIALLRNPIERAYSDYLMHIRDSIDDQRSLNDHISSPTSFLIRKGFYYEQLNHFFDQFDRHKIGIFLYDDLRQDSIAFMQEMYEFIGVDKSFSPDVSVIRQVSQVPKSRTVNTVLRNSDKTMAFARPLLKAIIPSALRERLHSFRFKLIDMNSTKNVPSLSDEDRKQLLAIYRDDILKLQELIQRDLSAWLS